MTDQTTTTPTVAVHRHLEVTGGIVFPEGEEPTFQVHDGPTSLHGRTWTVNGLSASYHESGTATATRLGRFRYWANTTRLAPDGTVDPDAGGEWDFASGAYELDNLMAEHLPAITHALVAYGDMPHNLEVGQPVGPPEFSRGRLVRWGMRTAGLDHRDPLTRNRILDMEESWPAAGPLRHPLVRFYYAARAVAMSGVGE